MSAAAVAYAPTPRPEVPRRPRLVAVPCAGGPGVRRRVRATPFGRAVLLVVVAGLVTGLGMAILGGGSTGRGHSVTVTPGQTLSQIAAHELPDEPVDAAVSSIQLANNLPSAQVQSGQQLVIPGG